MSSIVSRRPSSRNHWNEAFWMSIRFGRSRTWGRWEKDLRARGEATLVVKKSGLPMDWRVQAKVGVQTGGRAGRRRNQPGYRTWRPDRKQKPRRAPNSDRQSVALPPDGRKGPSEGGLPPYGVVVVVAVVDVVVAAGFGALKWSSAPRSVNVAAVPVPVWQASTRILVPA